MKYLFALAVLGVFFMSKNLNGIIGSDKDIFSDKYDALFLKFASRYSLNPSMIKAIAANESMVGKYQTLEKIGGTTGIMHIKLATAQMFNKDLTQVELNRPEIEIEYGVRYVRWLWDRYAKYDNATRIKYTVMAYNGGPGRVDQVIKDPTKYLNDSWFKNITTYYARFTGHINKLNNVA